MNSDEENDISLGHGVSDRKLEAPSSGVVTMDLGAEPFIRASDWQSLHNFSKGSPGGVTNST